MTRSRRYKFPRIRTWRHDLETPLLAEQEREGTDVGVLLVSDALFGEVRGNVSEHRKGCVRFVVVSVRSFEAVRTFEIQRIGETCQHCLRDDVGARYEVFEDWDIFLYDIGENR